MNEAEEFGYQFPTSTSEELGEALEALTRGLELDMDELEVGEEEEIQTEWDEEVGECDDHDYSL